MPTSGTNAGISLTLKGLKKVDRFWRTSKKASAKALTTAVRVEAFNLSKKLKQALRSGSPGGRTLRPLSFIARRSMRRGPDGRKIRQSPSRKPLARLALGIRYMVERWDPFVAKVGFVTPKGMDTGTWRTLAKEQQEGFTRPLTSRIREAIVNRGADLGTIEGGDSPFFLRKSTRALHVPARPIVRPFWRQQERKSPVRIKKNFKLKLKGQRI